ncbi:NepR family anti-sigma factor [Agrobacterium rhizogenes]|uniref:NepR family anti-sigma factor n=1 Tax=Rhizobium rhizogenes TaxID=359 RepID=UPI0022B63AEB|nr:NepR family anti-sigma factor [Rhizobium rhizogenes]MCZ7449323.1 NepR family anti-sigma factor [Rhizobium rhizogenes]
MSMFQSDQDQPDNSAPPQVPHSGRAVISRKLRELYDAVQDEGIPDKFLDLLEKLDEAESRAKMKASEE